MKRGEFLLLLGGAATAARALRAQQKAMPVIGFLSGGSAAPRFVVAFHRGPSGTGWVEGQEVAIEYRWAEGRYERLPALAADLVSRKVDLIVTQGVPALLAAKSATSTIPIVFSTGDNPVASGLVSGFNRPGGNITGVSIMMMELTPKRLEFLAELVPQARAIALLVNANNPVAERIIQDVEQAAHVKGVQLQILKASQEREIDTAFTTLSHLNVGGLLVASDAFFAVRAGQLVALAARHAVPAIYDGRDFVELGGLISYGPELSERWRLVRVYVGKILAGAKPADLPVQQPTRFELVVNLNTAKALGLTIPPSILARADEVIE